MRAPKGRFSVRISQGTANVVKSFVNAAAEVNQSCPYEQSPTAKSEKEQPANVWWSACAEKQTVDAAQCASTSLISFIQTERGIISLI